MTSPFKAPAPSETLPPATIVGHLMIIRPLSHEHGISTVHGVKDAIRADVCVLTQQSPTTGAWGVAYEEILWFSGKLIGALKSRLGDVVLARMAQGAGKPGMQPPYELHDATGDAQAVAAAQAWLDAHPGFMSKPLPPAAPAPAPQPQAPAQQPYQQQVPAYPQQPAGPVPLPGMTPAYPTTPQAPIPLPGMAPAALPQPAPVPAYPAAQPAPIPAPLPAAPAPMVPQQYAAPAPQMSPVGPIDPAVLGQLTDEARRQLAAILAQQAG